MGRHRKVVLHFDSGARLPDRSRPDRGHGDRHAARQPSGRRSLRRRRSAHSIRGDCYVKREGMTAATWSRFRRSRLAIGALVYIGIVALVAICAPLLTSDPNSVDLASRLRPPDRTHRLGTDDLGRDVLSRVIYGARISLSVGFTATAISLIIGSLLGAIAGYYDGLAADRSRPLLSVPASCAGYRRALSAVISDSDDRARADVVDNRGAVHARG